MAHFCLPYWTIGPEPFLSKGFFSYVLLLTHSQLNLLPMTFICSAEFRGQSMLCLVDMSSAPQPPPLRPPPPCQRSKRYRCFDKRSNLNLESDVHLDKTGSVHSKWVRIRTLSVSFYGAFHNSEDSEGKVQQLPQVLSGHGLRPFVKTLSIFLTTSNCNILK